MKTTMVLSHRFYLFMSLFLSKMLHPFKDHKAVFMLFLIFCIWTRLVHLWQFFFWYSFYSVCRVLSETETDRHLTAIAEKDWKPLDLYPLFSYYCNMVFVFTLLWKYNFNFDGGYYRSTFDTWFQDIKLRIPKNPSLFWKLLNYFFLLSDKSSFNKQIHGVNLT